jgi:hypothetical protein
MHGITLRLLQLPQWQLPGAERIRPDDFVQISNHSLMATTPLNGNAALSLNQ